MRVGQHEAVLSPVEPRWRPMWPPSAAREVRRRPFRRSGVRVVVRGARRHRRRQPEIVVGKRTNGGRRKKFRLKRMFPSYTRRSARNQSKLQLDILSLYSAERLKNATVFFFFRKLAKKKIQSETNVSGLTLKEYNANYALSDKTDNKK